MCCTLKLDWDDPLPPQYEAAWLKWKESITHLNKHEINRCYKSSTKQVVDTQLHVFCDGSEIAYGAVAYLRQQDVDSTVSSSIVMGKSRLTPISRTSMKTTPRIELNAAKIGVDLYIQLEKELRNIDFTAVYFWTDSMAVLKYLAAATGHFQAYIANRVAYILSATRLEQWRKVPGKLNPADILSRGVTSVEDFLCDDRWKTGPSFLKTSPKHWPKTENVPSISEDDPELKKKALSLVTKTNEIEGDPVNTLLNSSSNFFKIKCRIAAFLRLKDALRKREFIRGPIQVKELYKAETEILKIVQAQHFPDALRALRKGKPITRKNNLHKLSLFLDQDNLIRVGGRLSYSCLDYDEKHPILLHSNAHPVRLLLAQTHEKSGHMGREWVLTNLKRKYHILKVNSTIRKMIRKCTVCRKVQGKVSTQIMSTSLLSPDRVKSDNPVFTHTATDLFGLFYVSKGRGNRQEKRYGVMFTCLCSRAVHLEITPGLDADSYLNALRRFICRR